MLAAQQPEIMAAKTLYLDGRRRVRVWREGPSLCLRVRGAALQRVPLQRICRIVVSGQVEWATPALLACAEAGIGVMFLRGNGAIRARLYGPTPIHRCTSMSDLIDMIVESPGGASRIRLWMEACAHQARRQLLMRLQRTVPPMQPQSSAVSVQIANRVLLHVRQHDLHRFDVCVQAFLASHVSQLFSGVGIQTCQPGYVIENLDLESGFVEVLIWNLQRTKIRTLKKLATRAKRHGRAFPEINLFTAAGFYESQAENVEEYFQKLLMRLQAYLLEILEFYAD